MSQYFEMGDRTLWNPSNGVSLLFMRHVAVYEVVLDLPSGIGAMQDNDESRIDPDGLAAFVHALLRWHRRTSHGVILALSDGFVATVLALAERAGIEVDWESADFSGRARNGHIPPRTPAQDDWATALRRESSELVRSMAH